MKKSFLALALVAGLGAVWTGATWYTGKQIEEQYPSFIQQLNQELNKNTKNLGIAVEVKDINFKRSLFSSEVDYNIQINEQNNNLTLPVHSQIYHGPLPLNLLQQFKLKQMLVAVASARSQLVQNEDTKTWFELAKGKSPFTVESSFDFNFNAQVIGQIADLEGDINGTSINLQGANFHFDLNEDVKLVSNFDFQANRLYLKLTDNDPASDVKTTSIDFDNLKLQSNTQTHTSVKAFSGTQNFSVAKVLFDVQPKSKNEMYESLANLPESNPLSLVINQLDVKSDSKLELNMVDLNMVDTNLKITTADIQANQISFGKFSQDTFVRLDEKSFNDLTLAYAQNDPYKINEALMSTLKENNKFSQPIKLTNSAGSLQFDIGFEPANFDMEQMQQNLYSLFKGFNFKLKLEKPALQQFIQNMLLVSGEDTVSAQQKAQEALDLNSSTVIGKVVEEGLLLDQNNSFTLDFEIKDQKATLNGNDVPDSSLKRALMLAFMLIPN